MELLKLDAERYEVFELGKILSFKNGIILLTPFLGNGQMSQELLNKITDTANKNILHTIPNV